MQLINNTPNVPAAVGPYSQACKSGSLLFCSGMLPILPSEGKIVASDIEGQTEQVLVNISALLAGQGLSLANVVKATVFLNDMADFPKFNPIYEKHFGSHKPARSTFQVAKLPLAALIEIEVIAEFPQA
jgi:2-iminobutanoate/2-iminopropanoate deaminase